ncbi:MAG: hypothetical protein DRP75_03270 [Candidatus Omnitrophota bacterium]|nr:MAG: hypothetical protein DRP75_03270 [Candidatus Omnitrophota bacterium]
MSNGYQKHGNKLVEWHRHALAHELRPDNNWVYDLNTESQYGSPKLVNNNQLYLNIPHFIDSCILELEKLCKKITSSYAEAEEVMKKFRQYISKHSLNKPQNF